MVSMNEEEGRASVFILRHVQGIVSVHADLEAAKKASASLVPRYFGWHTLEEWVFGESAAKKQWARYHSAKNVGNDWELCGE